MSNIPYRAVSIAMPSVRDRKLRDSASVGHYRLSIKNFNKLYYISGAVGKGTSLQSGRSQVRLLTVSMEFFIHKILPAALWPWGRLSLEQK